MNALLFQVDWQQVFLPHTSIIELALRGSLVYLVVVIILRFMPSRQVGGVGISDLLVVVLVATAAQDAMATDDSSITGGLVLVATIIGWSYLFSWVGYKHPPLQRFLNPSPLLLVKNGQVFEQNMERGLISKRELMSQLRQQGVHSLNEVDRAYIEGDGRISIFTKDSRKKASKKTKNSNQDNGQKPADLLPADSSSAEMQDQQDEAAIGDEQKPEPHDNVQELVDGKRRLAEELVDQGIGNGSDPTEADKQKVGNTELVMDEV